MTAYAPTVLCMSSYEKGQEFLRACRAAGCRTLLLTVEKLRDAAWPRESLDGFHAMPDLGNREHVINAVSYLARSERIDRIVALDEFDLEVAALLREHLRIPGMGETAVRSFRDKLAMRSAAEAAGVDEPAYIGAIHHSAIAEFLDRIPAPWVLKPRTQASAIGIRKLHHRDEVWPVLEQLGDAASHHLIEQFIPGEVFHVDGLVVGGDVVFAEAHQYARPPFEVMHGGGVFSTRTLSREGEAAVRLREAHAKLVRGMGLQEGATHAEFIRSADGRFLFLEIAARVGGANIAETVEHATGVNLWREWARIVAAGASGTAYELPEPRREHAGILISLARQEWPDTSAYQDQEIVWRMQKRHHAGLIVRSEDPERVQGLLTDYMRRFYDDFTAVLPPPEKATD